MLTIYLRKTNGVGQKIQLPQSAPFNSLMFRIYASLGHEYELRSQSSITSEKQASVPQFELYHRGLRLNQCSTNTLAEMGIQNNSIIHVIEHAHPGEQSSIILKLIIADKLLQYNIEYETTISELKHLICTHLQIRDEQLTLSYLGMELQGGKTAREYQFSREVLLSGQVSGNINALAFKQTVSVGSNSEDSQKSPRIMRPPGHARMRMKKAESLNVEPEEELERKIKNINFSSQNLAHNLKRIEEKFDQSRNDSQLNDSSQYMQCEVDENLKIKFIEPQQKQSVKPKLTLESLSKPWPGNGQLIETESIIDDDSEQCFNECYLQLSRCDGRRQFTLECTRESTFEDARAMIAKLEKVEIGAIVILFNCDEVSKSNIERKIEGEVLVSKYKEEKDRPKENLLIVKNNWLRQKVIERSIKSKSRTVAMEYELVRH